jgi:putative hydrolase of the HAD superfamily
MTVSPRAIFFDMDGTILDWQTGMEESWLAACEAHCDGTFDPAAMHEAIRKRRTWFWDDAARAMAGRMDLDAASREIVRHAFADSGLASVELAYVIANDYRARRHEAIAPYSGAIETLKAFRARGHRMALITNGNAVAQRLNVERFGLPAYFDCVIIEGEFGAGKPDERVFRHALSACSADARETWMIGDSLEADIATPVRMGMHAIWVNDGTSEARGGITPHRTVASIRELLDGT